MMLFTKSKIYILQSWKEFPKCRLCLSAFSILCLSGTESKDYQVICVLPVFSPTSDQNQIYKKSDWCFFFFFTKLCPCLLPDLPNALYSPAGPTPMTKLRLFCQTRIFPFLRSAPPFSIDVKSSRYPLQKREEDYPCLVRNNKSFEPFLLDPFYRRGRSLQEEILSVCLSVCP